MADANLFDVVLLGYRNDLAWARVLDFLNQLPPTPSGPPRLDRASVLPQTLFTALAAERAQPLRATLEGLGAQVAVVQAGHGPGPLPAGVSLPSAVVRPGQVEGIRPLTLVLVILLVAATYLWRTAEPAQVPAGRLAPQLERWRAGSERVDEAEAATLNTDAIALAEHKQYGEAVARLRRAVRLAPDHPVLTRNLQTVLFNWGVADLGAGQLDTAGERLRQAAELGTRADVLQALGITYLRQANYETAASTLEQALQLAPGDTSTLLALADAYLGQDKRAQALDLLRRAKEAGARGPEVDRKLEQLGREIDAEWDFVELQSAHFRVSFADDEDRTTVRLVLDTLEDAYDAAGSKFDYYPDGRTPVVLYTQQDFHTVTQTPDWAGAAFDGRIKLPVGGLTAADPAFARMARHEYAHRVVVQLTGGRCPVWLNEGLAVWAEEEQDGEREAWAENRIADQELFSLEDLSGTFTALPAARAEVAYAESYLAVRTLIDRYGARKIPAFLTTVSRAPTFNEAFAAVYPGDLSGFQDQLLRQLSG